MAHAARVLSEDSPAAPTVRLAVEQGRVTVSDASRVIDEPAEVQLRALERVTRGGSRNLAGAARQVNDETSRQEDDYPPPLGGGRSGPPGGGGQRRRHRHQSAQLIRVAAVVLRPGGLCRPRPQAGRGDGGAGQRHAFARDNRPSDTPRPGVGGGVRLPVRRPAGPLRLSAPGQPAPQAPAHLREAGISSPRGERRDRGPAPGWTRHGTSSAAAGPTPGWR